jgi:hypothetical protein
MSTAEEKDISSLTTGFLSSLYLFVVVILILSLLFSDGSILTAKSFLI